jgi:hypothetical protein
MDVKVWILKPFNLLRILVFIQEKLEWNESWTAPVTNAVYDELFTANKVSKSSSY